LDAVTRAKDKKLHVNGTYFVTVLPYIRHIHVFTSGIGINEKMKQYTEMQALYT